MTIHHYASARPCWKCGQRVEHYPARTFLWRWLSRMGRRVRWLSDGQAMSIYARVPAKHYVEKRNTFKICKGSEALP